MSSIIKEKTLVLTENFPPISGGSGRWFWELYSRLPKEEYLIVADNIEGAAEFDSTHDVSIIRIPLKSAEWGIKSFQGLKFYFNTIKKLRKIIKEHNITKIHTGRVIHEGVTAWLLSLFTNVKFITYVHGEDVETAATSGEHNLMVKQVCKHAETIICNSLNSADIVKRLGYATDEKVKVLHPGVDASRFVPAETDDKFKQEMAWTNKKVIITVGRLQQRKGQDMMLKAMPDILKSHPDALYAVIGRGECKEQLTQLVDELNLKDNVQLLDEITDQQMIQCYQQCDLFILPNRTIGNDIEGFGMVLVEAQACGKPVIAGDSGGTKETMVVNESGYILDCTNNAVIANKINQYLEYPEQLKKMGLVGRSHVENELDWVAHVEKAKQIFSNN
ncbi:glycosyltransferase family 4 protein [Thalassotalea eurytherma]|uniref:Glycosyl transferase family 1 n=1 Tax=Thalassotalea eurytherma TaxID=1144278 RepID=A0ABQ6H2F6_9GAMM|nr:glycosyltransferase family 4 protein [Thalassotalea eurytherma]GLX82094.1 glycosyl transferase family 1 [Thalassotalea eurytherma]